MIYVRWLNLLLEKELYSGTETVCIHRHHAVTLIEVRSFHNQALVLHHDRRRGN